MNIFTISRTTATPGHRSPISDPRVVSHIVANFMFSIFETSLSSLNAKMPFKHGAYVTDPPTKQSSTDSIELIKII